MRWLKREYRKCLYWFKHPDNDQLYDYHLVIKPINLPIGQGIRGVPMKIK